MSVVRVLNGQVGDGTTFITPEREAGRVAGVFKLVGRQARSAGPRRRVRRWLSASSTMPPPATR